MKLVFTWGEALKPDLARACVDGGLHVRDLLIATEYWLCLYKDPAVSQRLRPISDTLDLRIVPKTDDESAGDGGDDALK